MVRTLWLAGLLGAGLLGLVTLGGCTTTEGDLEAVDEMGADRDILYEGYRITIPAEAEIHRTLRAAHEHPGGISPTPTWRSTTVFPGAIVVRVPHRRGWLVLYDPDTESHSRQYLSDFDVEAREMILGSTRRGFINGIPSTETAGSHGSGVYFRTVRYDRTEFVTPAGLVGHYEDASHHTKQVFDRILESVRHR
jgi:hypothetical protein